MHYEVPTLDYFPHLRFSPQAGPSGPVLFCFGLYSCLLYMKTHKDTEYFTLSVIPIYNEGKLIGSCDNNGA